MKIPQKVLDSLNEHNEALLSIEKYDLDSHLPPMDGMIEFIQTICNSLLKMMGFEHLNNE